MKCDETTFILGLIAMISGLLAVLFYSLHDIVGAMCYPGYNPMSQAVSDLTAVDAPSFAIASGLSSVYGIFSCLCCVLLCVIMREQPKAIRIGIQLFTAMQFVSAIGYSLFPLSSAGYDGSIQSFIHTYVLTVAVVLLSIASLISLTIGGFRYNWRNLALFSIAAFLFMLAGAIGSNIVPMEYFGLVERFSTYSAVVFVGVLGILTEMEIKKERVWQASSHRSA